MAMDRRQTKITRIVVAVAVVVGVTAFVILPKAIANPQLQGSHVDLSKYTPSTRLVVVVMMLWTH